MQWWSGHPLLSYYSIYQIIYLQDTDNTPETLARIKHPKYALNNIIKLILHTTPDINKSLIKCATRCEIICIELSLGKYASDKSVYASREDAFITTLPSMDPSSIELIGGIYNFITFSRPVCNEKGLLEFLQK